MSNFVNSLKSEITRLARKETKQQISALRTASAQYRKDLADLKKVARNLEKRLAFVEKQEKRRVRKAPSAELAEGARFSAKGLKSHRQKLGLSAEDYGLLAGVSAQTIYSYELGKSKPRKAQVAKLVVVRGLGKREAHRRLELLRK